MLSMSAVPLSSLPGFSYQIHNFYDEEVMMYTKKTYCSCSASQLKSENVMGIEARSLKIVKDLQSKGINMYSEKRIAALYQFLLDLGLESKTIEGQLLETPHLLSFAIKSWTDTCEVFLEHGLSSRTILQNIAVNPQFLQVKPSKLGQTLFKYREIKIGKHNILSLINRYPELFSYKPQQIQKRLGLVSSIFPPTEFKSVIWNNPNILVERWKDVMDKIMYIHTEMGLDQPHLANSKALALSFLEIKTRHQFLYRAGLYKTPNLLRDKQSHKRNHSLSDIMDTNAAYFAKKVARLTEEEYNVFASIMKEEEKLLLSDSEENDSDDSDYDDDDDDDSTVVNDELQ
ncbi:transcription termination factor 4, mitochondrial isoform X4 [Procambarus clarkii]